MYKYLGHREGLEGKDLRDMIQTAEENQHKSDNKIFYILPHSSSYFFLLAQHTCNGYNWYSEILRLQ